VDASPGRRAGPGPPNPRMHRFRAWHDGRAQWGKARLDSRRLYAGLERACRWSFCAFRAAGRGARERPARVDFLVGEASMFAGPPPALARPRSWAPKISWAHG